MYTESLNLKLKKARLDTGLNQMEVAEYTKIPQSTIARFETGNRYPSAEQLGILADFYEVSADWLLGTKGGKNHPNIKIPEKRN